MSEIERDDDVLPIYRRDLRRLTVQADQLAKDRVERNAEIKRLRQGLWDCAVAAGFDHDGDLTPEALASDIVELALGEVRELRRDYDEALGGGLA